MISPWPIFLQRRWNNLATSQFDQHLGLPNTVASANAFDSPIYFITILATEIQVLTVTTFDPEQTMGITLTLATKLTLDFGQLHVIPLSKMFTLAYVMFHF